jgi:hypothetical protein
LRSLSAFTATRARASGDIRALSSEKGCLPAMLFLVNTRLNPFQMHIIEAIGDWNKLLVKSRPSGLVASNQELGTSFEPVIQRLEAYAIVGNRTVPRWEL